MTPPLIALAALAVALFLPPRAWAQERKMADARQPTRTVEAILRLERDIMDYIRAKDTRSLERLLTADFVYRTPGGELSRDDFLKGVASVPGTIISVEGEGQRVSVYGETAILTGVQRARVRGDDGKEQEGVNAFTDVFVRRNGRWRLALAYGVDLPAESAPPKK